ncbi:MAG: DNA polymerase III subunit gamma/tau, partial [bacterium]
VCDGGFIFDNEHALHIAASIVARAGFMIRADTGNCKRQRQGRADIIREMSEGQTLYRKYRPQTFDEVAGQTAVIHILRAALNSGKLSHAYLFCGPRGTGKTTSARLLAKSLNCLTYAAPTSEPCNQCKNCTAIRDGNSMDVIEMDAASNRGIDEVRELRESVRFPPTASRKKVYIIDESHMLTKEACNALLKTLEEPPQYVVFILATTDPNRMPSTIVSRCQRYDFNRLSADELRPYLQRIAREEGFTIEDEKVYDLLYIYSEGAARDAVGLLEQLALLDNRRISEKTVAELLGVPEQHTFFELLDAVAQRDFRRTLELSAAACQRGASFWNFVNTLTAILRDLMAVKQGLRPVDPYRDEEIEQLKEVSRAFSYEALFSLFQRLGQFRYVFKWETEGRLLWDIAFLELFRTLDGAPSSTKAPLPTDPSARSKPTAPPSSSGKPAPSRMETPSSPPPVPPPKPYQQPPSNTPLLKESPALLPVESPLEPSVSPVPGSNGEPEFPWDKFIAFVAVTNPSLAALLIRAKPVSFDGDALTVGFPKAFNLPRSFLRRTGLGETENRLQDFWSRPMALKTTDLDDRKPGAPITTPVEEFEARVQQVLEFFPGSRKVN